MPVAPDQPLDHHRSRRWRMRSVPGLVVIATILAATNLRPAAAAELLAFTDPKCAACIQFEREVGRIYDRTLESQAAPLTRLPFAAPLDTRYGSVERPKGMPTFVVIDGGHEVGRFEGYTSDESFWMSLTALLSRDNLPRDDDR